uniref:Putative single-strand selective monofunctional uracil dna glycosylase n=1 Tax=Ixodes ricinus TaxID=34613 RepID=A0A131XTC5_IXORI
MATCSDVASEYLCIERKQCELLLGIPYGDKVSHVYSPVDYARETHECFVRKYCTGAKTVIFLGMNPGPFGMAQNGVPFGDTEYVRNWLGIEGEVGKPACEHPKRTIVGLNCPRKDVSGQRFWGLFSELCPSAHAFFGPCFVHNYCPLVFLMPSGANLTPNKLPAQARLAMQAVCDDALVAVLSLLRPKLVLGVGCYARDRASAVLRKVGDSLGSPTVACLTHPSPASPKANRGWKALALAELNSLGVLGCLGGQPP